MCELFKNSPRSPLYGLVFTVKLGNQIADVAWTSFMQQRFDFESNDSKTN